MDLIQANLNEKVFKPAHLNDNFTYVTVSVEEAEMSSVTWADIQDVLDEEWEIGGLAMSTDAIRGRQNFHSSPVAQTIMYCARLIGWNFWPASSRRFGESNREG